MLVIKFAFLYVRRVWADKIETNAPTLKHIQMRPRSCWAYSMWVNACACVRLFIHFNLELRGFK